MADTYGLKRITKKEHNTQLPHSASPKGRKMPKPSKHRGY